MLRAIGVVGICMMLSGCAFPRPVQRFGVEYNSALEEMSNQQTLLNIMRAKDGMPTHFTSVAVFRGNINLTATASLNGQFRGEGVTDMKGSSGTTTNTLTNSTTTNLTAPGAPPSTSALVSSVMTPVTGTSTSSTAVEGVDLYTPQVSGQLASGTNFDVAVFDTQKFFQGITSALPFPTVETLLHQGIDNRVVELLTITQVEFRLDATAAGKYGKGDRILHFVNDPTDPAAAAAFNKFVNCYALDAGVVALSSTNVAAVSRVTRGADGKFAALPIDKLTVIDGDKFELSDNGVIGDDTNGDSSVFLARVKAEKRVPRLSLREAAKCASAGERITRFTTKSGRALDIIVPEKPAPDPIYLGNGQALIFHDGRLQEFPVTMDITFRSPEGMFRYIGQYLQVDNGKNISVDGGPLFSIADGHSKTSLAEATYRGKVYRLENEAGNTRNAQIFTLLQQLINLHKEATDRPTAIPVRAIP